MSKKILLLAFKGEPMCFAHVLLHALDLNEKGYTVKVIIEGAATALLDTLDNPATPYSELYRKVKQADLIDCVCKACAAKMGTLAEAQRQILPLKGEVLGHPGLTPFLEDGYEILTF